MRCLVVMIDNKTKTSTTVERPAPALPKRIAKENNFREAFSSVPASVSPNYGSG